MLRKRLIFTLIYSDGYFMQIRNFRLQKVGDINWLMNNYNFREIATSIDELIILNASRNQKIINSFANTISEIVDEVFIPIAAGGGIRTLDDARKLFANGADKIVLNSALFLDKLFISQLVNIYGSQSIVASIDYKKYENINRVFINDGSKMIDFDLGRTMQYLDELKVGEVYLNSMEKDGTGFGYDLETINSLKDIIKLPLIIAGGAGNEVHFLEGLRNIEVNAVATANLFNFIGNGLPNARNKLLIDGENIANWNEI